MKELDTAPIYYVYVHFCKDDGLPFYVGKGKGKRAQDKQNRSEHWKRVANKHGYTIEFAWENIPERSAFELEEFLIARFWLEKYPITNTSDGWEGNSRRKQTNQNKQNIRVFINENRRFPNRSKPEEKQLHDLLVSYISPSVVCFDPLFRKEMEILGYGAHTEENKQKIRDFVNENKRLPSWNKPEEKKMAQMMGGYCSPSHGSFDPVFRTDMIVWGYGANYVEENKQKIRDFYKENRRLPSRSKPEEKQLCNALRSYCSPKCVCFDPVFHAEMEALGYGQRKKKLTTID